MRDVHITYVSITLKWLRALDGHILSGSGKPDWSIVSGRHPADPPNSQLWLCVVDVSTHDDHGQLSGKTTSTVVVLENNVCALGRRQASSGECGEFRARGQGEDPAKMPWGQVALALLS